MSTAGVLIIVGALLNTVFFGLRAVSAAWFAVGIAGIVMDRWVVRGRDKGKGTVLKYTLAPAAILTVVLATVLLGTGFDREAAARSMTRITAGNVKKDPESAEIALERLKENFPDMPEICLNLSTVNLMMGKPEEAMKLLDEISLVEPMDGSACFDYAMAYYQQADYDMCMYYLKKVLIQDPEMPEAYLYAGECAYRKEDLKAAEYFFKKSVELNPDLPYTHYHLARIKMLSMQYREAGEELKTALGLNPDRNLRDEAQKLLEEAEYYNRMLQTATQYKER